MKSSRKGIGNKVEAVLGVDAESFVVLLRFVGGLAVDVSLARLFAKPRGLCAEVLKGGLFERCFVESGALAWPNGLELCPDALHRWALEDRALTRVA